MVAVVREEEVALENRGSELALVSRQANRKSDEGRCIMQRDSPSVDVSDEKKPATVRFFVAGSKNKRRTTHVETVQEWSDRVTDRRTYFLTYPPCGTLSSRHAVGVSALTVQK